MRSLQRTLQLEQIDMSQPTRNSIYLQFPSVKAFIEYLKNYCNIYEVGLVVRRSVQNTAQGIPWSTYFIRITKHASSYNEILVCDIPFWSDLVDIDSDKEIDQKRNEAIKAVKDELEKGLTRVKIFEAEFCPEPDL